jgi:serine/threonine protein kinase
MAKFASSADLSDVTDLCEKLRTELHGLTLTTNQENILNILEKTATLESAVLELRKWKASACQSGDSKEDYGAHIAAHAVETLYLREMAEQNLMNSLEYMTRHFFISPISGDILADCGEYRSSEGESISASLRKQSQANADPMSKDFTSHAILKNDASIIVCGHEKFMEESKKVSCKETDSVVKEDRIKVLKNARDAVLCYLGAHLTPVVQSTYPDLNGTFFALHGTGKMLRLYAVFCPYADCYVAFELSRILLDLRVLNGQTGINTQQLQSFLRTMLCIRTHLKDFLTTAPANVPFLPAAAAQTVGNTPAKDKGREQADQQSAWRSQAQDAVKKFNSERGPKPNSPSDSHTYEKYSTFADVEPVYWPREHTRPGQKSWILMAKDSCGQQQIALKLLREADIYQQEVTMHLLVTRLKLAHTVPLLGSFPLGWCPGTKPLPSVWANAGYWCLVLPQLRPLPSGEELAQLSRSQLLELCRQLLMGVQGLHKSGIMHGDLCPDNLMMMMRKDPDDAFISTKINFSNKGGTGKSRGCDRGIMSATGTISISSASTSATDNIPQLDASTTTTDAVPGYELCIIDFEQAMLMSPTVETFGGGHDGFRAPEMEDGAGYRACAAIDLFSVGRCLLHLVCSQLPETCVTALWRSDVPSRESLITMDAWQRCLTEAIIDLCSPQARLRPSADHILSRLLTEETEKTDEKKASKGTDTPVAQAVGLVSDQQPVTTSIIPIGHKVNEKGALKNNKNGLKIRN